jgi:hypothetical protein
MNSVSTFGSNEKRISGVAVTNQQVAMTEAERPADRRRQVA